MVVSEIKRDSQKVKIPHIYESRNEDTLQNDFWFCILYVQVYRRNHDIQNIHILITLKYYEPLIETLTHYLSEMIIAIC